MSNATPTLTNEPPPRCRRGCPDHREHLEAAALALELGQVLRRTGRYNLTALTRRCQADGFPIRRETLTRWFNGRNAPFTVDPVERVAHAAGVDLAYLMVGGAR